MASRRHLPDVPERTKPFAFWTQFVSPGQPTSSDAGSKQFDFDYSPHHDDLSDEFPPDLDDVTALREQFEQELAETKSATRKKREKTRKRLVKTVSNKLDEEKFPLTNRYVETWLKHNHEQDHHYHPDCKVCSEAKLNSIQTREVKNLKLNNPLTEQRIRDLQKRCEEYHDETTTISESYLQIDERESAANFGVPDYNVSAQMDFFDVQYPMLPNEYDNLTEEVYFSDGIRKIDFVLVYEKSDKQSEKASKAENRQKYVRAIQREGIDTEEIVVRKSDKEIHFICVHVPFDVLASFAENLSFRAPVSDCERKELNWSYEFQQKYLSCLPNIMYQDIPYEFNAYFTAPFKLNNFDKFLGAENPETFFTIRHRIRIAHEILITATYGSRKKCEIGYERLVESGALTAAYPLHDGAYTPPEEVADNSFCWNTRQILKFFWANPKQWFKYQPLDLIRDYFGEKMSFYFAWLGFYTAWLLIATVVGLIVLTISVSTMFSNPAADQICTSGETFRMCPQCDFGCESWYLSDTCIFARIAHIFDNGATIFFGAFISLWSVFFLEFWKRSTATLSYRWDVHDFQPQEDQPRFQYMLKAKVSRPNPVTGNEEAYFSTKTQSMRIFAGIGTLIFMMMIVLIFVIGVIVYRSLIMQPLYELAQDKYSWGAKYTPTVAVATGALIQVILIQISGAIYTWVAETLTEWETHRTQIEHENHLAFKIFVFQFLNQYSAVLYVAFFKGRFSGYPGNYTPAFSSDARLEQCTNNDCLMEMAQNLLIIFVGKQIVNNTLEVGKPYIMRVINNYKSGASGEGGDSSSKVKRQMEVEYTLPPCPDLFEEYLEMVLQFGFVTIFSCSFPLAPLFALLNNFIEIRVDANKYVCQVRRGIPQRANNIGIWFELMAAISRVAVLCNAFLISFTSDFLNKVLYQNLKNEPDLDGYISFMYPFAPDNYHSSKGLNETERCRYKGFRDEKGDLTIYYWKLFGFKLLFLILFEHCVIVIGILIDMFVPDIPEELDLKMKREQYIARQTMNDSSAPREPPIDEYDHEDNWETMQSRLL